MLGVNVFDPVGSREAGGHRGGGSGELRHGNLTQILRYLRDRGPSSRHHIARGCGLGVSTMTDLIGDLRARRLVVELDPVRRPGAGRPTRPIALDGAPWCVLGVQVDADQVLVIAATVGGEQLWQETVWCELAGRPDGAAVLADVLAGLLDRFATGTRLVAVQIGVPGYVAGGVVTRSRVLGWTDVALADAVSSALTGAGLDQVHVGVSSDSHLAGLHAVRTVLDEPAPSVAVYLGGLREVDSALVVNGEIFRGAAGGAGDLAHLNVAPDGPGCWCGRRGCLNAQLRTEQLLTRSDLVCASEVGRMVAEQPLKATAVLAEAAAAGETAVLQVLGEAGAALGRALDDVLGLVNPGVVALGGSVGQLAPYLLPTATEQLQTRTAELPYAGAQVVALDEGVPQVAAGAVLAARDACLYDPLGLTSPLP